ncbi:MAG: hypothetical protein ACI4OP_02175 [Candidatus Coprovivens sp.]
MCFILNKKDNIILSAEKDIVVAKYGIKTSSLKIDSLPRFKEYYFGILYQSNIEIFQGPILEEYLTGKGLYSIKLEDTYKAYYNELYRYCTSPYFRDFFRYTDRSHKFVVCKAIIPKGSKYIQSSLGYVSDKLIVSDEIIPSKISLNPEDKFYNELKEIFY